MTSLTDIASKIINRKGNENLANTMVRSEVIDAIEAAVLVEREACAKVCEDILLFGNKCAAAIRARGE